MPSRSKRAFYEKFDRELPDDINSAQVYMIAAESIDPATERAVQLLADQGIPINAALFRHFRDREAEIYTRRWLVEPDGRSRPSALSKQPYQFSEPDRSAGAEDSSLLSPSFPRVDQPLRPCLDEPHPHLGAMCTWSPADGDLEYAPIVSIRRRKESDFADSDRQVQFFWHAFASRFAWDFLPADWLYALWNDWLSAGQAEDLSQIALTRFTFRKRLRYVANSSGEWVYTRSRPGHLMDAHEPLTESSVDWTPDEPQLAICGLRRIGTMRSASSALKAPGS